MKKRAPEEWRKQVAESCPGRDPSWARATKRKTECGFLASGGRYSCVLTGVPAKAKAVEGKK